MKRIVNISPFIMVIICIAMIYSDFHIEQSHNITYLNTWQYQEKEISLPTSFNESEKIVLESDLSNIENKNSIFVSIKYSLLSVYLDNQLVYQSSLPKNNMKSAGVQYEIIDLSQYSGNHLVLEYTPLLQNSISYSIDSPIIGEGGDIYEHLISNEWVNLVLEVGLIGVGLCLIFSQIFFKKAHFFLLGTLSLACGVYTLVQMDVVHLMMPNSYLSYYLEFTLLMLLPFIITLIIDRNIQKGQPLFDALKVCLSLNMLYQHIMHFVFHVEFRELLLYTYISIIVMMVVCISGIIINRKYLARFNKEMFNSILPLLIGGFIDIFLSLRWHSEVKFFRVGLIFFVSMQIYYNVILYIENLHKKLEAETYKRLAYTDGLTGLQNRLAFEKDIKEMEEKQKVIYTCFSFDINGLKEVNDQYGHLEGDKLILGLTTILNKAISNHGNIYRIGGDEFIVLLTVHNQEEIDKYLNTIEQCRQEYNKDAIHQIRFAVGVSIYDQAKDTSIEKMIARADALMYEDKRRKKGYQNAIMSAQ